MTTAMTRSQGYNLLAYGFDEERLRLIKDQIAQGASDPELALFLAQCQRTGLDPFSRQIYCIGRWDSRANRKVFATQISIDGARLVAERSNRYAGQEGPFWCGSDGAWKDVWLDSFPPSAAKVGVYKKGFERPLYAVANWDSYAQTDKQGNPTSMWAKFPALMLGKVAEMLALRRAFPMELSGIYSSEEIAQAQSETVDVEAKPTEQPKQLAPKIQPEALPVKEDDEQPRFTNTAENRSMFFAMCNKLGVPNTEENVQKLRKLWRHVDGCYMSEFYDLLSDKIAEGDA